LVLQESGRTMIRKETESFGEALVEFKEYVSMGLELARPLLLRGWDIIDIPF
jgi:hypothetical protein